MPIHIASKTLTGFYGLSQVFIFSQSRIADSWLFYFQQSSGRYAEAIYFFWLRYFESFSICTVALCSVAVYFYQVVCHLGRATDQEGMIMPPTTATRNGNMIINSAQEEISENVRQTLTDPQKTGVFVGAVVGEAAARLVNTLVNPAASYGQQEQFSGRGRE